MDAQDQETLGRWNGLASRDASSRMAAMEHIRQEVLSKVEAIGPEPTPSPSPSPCLSLASGSPARSDLNAVLAHLLMLTKRCPFEDVRERCVRLLQAVQKKMGRQSAWTSQCWCQGSGSANPKTPGKRAKQIYP